MSFLRLVVCGIKHYRRLHAGFFLGVVLACAILTGALLMGDSVDYSLRQIASLRLGRVAFAMNWPNRFFSQGLVLGLHAQDPRVQPAAVLLLSGMASVPSAPDRPHNQLNRVQILGVDPAFWRFTEDGAPPADLGPQQAAIAKHTALALGIRPGDDLLLRVVKNSLMPFDAPLAARRDDLAVTSLVTVKIVLSDSQLGRFSLAANQTAPHNVFVDRSWLQEQTGQAGLSNLILTTEGAPLDDLQAALDKAWQLDDIGLRFKTHPSGIVQLESDRVFIDEEVVRVAHSLPGASETLTYLVNSIAKGDRMTPYSFVEAGPVPKDLRDDQVVISQWLADHLGAQPGDTIDIAYMQLLPNSRLVEQRRTFSVHSVVSMNELAIERELAPQFPGLSDVENCRDWSIGMPMDEARLKDPANEAYWREYGQTPKLLVTLKAGQDMWANRFGSVTAIRFPAAENTESSVRASLREKISAEKLGLQFIPVKKIALDAVNQALDFGGLFVGMSFFLIIAALILLGLLYAFGIQQRAPEMGLLSAVGFSRAKVCALLLCEALPTAFVGALLGADAGAGYAYVLLAALARYWPGAVAGTAIRFHTDPNTLFIGMAATFACVVCVVLATIVRATRRPARELLTIDLSAIAPVADKQMRRWFLFVPISAIALAILTVVYVCIEKPNNLAEPFFAVGIFLLIAGLGGYSSFLTYLARRTVSKKPRLWKMAVTNLARRRGRSLSVAGLTACGCFLVFAVSSMQQNVSLRATERSSGTGGFAVFAETTAPLVGSPDEINKTLDAEAVPLRVRDGDDAGCLNLNRAQTPRVFGVDPQRLSALGAFSRPHGDTSVWDLLNRELPEGIIPALVGDSDTAMWGLQKKTGETSGDVLVYRDESGKEAKLKLVGTLPMRLSVFQGSILISEAAFTKLFPSETGFRAFLIDTPPDRASDLVARLNRDFDRFGMDAVPAVQRLRDFYTVESTYMTMFLVLGALGLVLGAGGVAVVVLRNLFERRAEIALLHAVGYERSTVFRLLLIEHFALTLAGMVLGTLAAAVGIVPLILSSQTIVSPAQQAILLALIILANLISVATVLRLGLPPNPIPNLRQE